MLHYDPETGIFIWRVRRGKGLVGSVAGQLRPSGYVEIGINGRRCTAGRLAWLYVTGEWPAAEVDHRDLDRANNRWSNLRAATRAQNAQNRRLPSTNTSGLRGAWWNKSAQKWESAITFERQRHHLGVFDTAEAAHVAYMAAAAERHGEFAARINR